jgi:hypothetical protein
MTYFMPDNVQEVNHRRVDRWHDAATDDWTLGDWANAMQGEAGEVGDAVKKIRRHQAGASQAYNTPPLHEAIENFCIEVADTMLYMDLLVMKMAAAFGISKRDMDEQLHEALIYKFNKVSKAQGWDDLIVTKSCVCGTILDMEGAAGVEIGGVYHRSDKPCFHGTAHEIADMLNEQTTVCTCGEYQFLTGERVDERNGILHRTDGPCYHVMVD